MARVGAVVRRGEDYGVVVAVSDTDFSAVEVEWTDGTTERVAVADVEWVDSGSDAGLPEVVHIVRRGGAG